MLVLSSSGRTLSIHGALTMAEPPMAVASPVTAPALTTMEAQIPDGLTEGESFQVMTPTGPATLQVPPGLKGGMKMAFQTAAAPVAVPQAVPAQTIEREYAVYQMPPPQAVPVASTAVPPVQAMSAQSVQPAHSPPVQVQVLQPPAVAVTANLMPYYWGRHPQMHSCQYCGHHGPTQVGYESGPGTYILSGSCCFFGCVLGCCLIPFCMDEAKDAVHHCTSCRMRLGMKRVMG